MPDPVQPTNFDQNEDSTQSLQDKFKPVIQAAKILGAMAIVVVAIWQVEDRYVHAQDWNTYKSEQAQAIQSFQQNIKGQMIDRRRQELQDEIFILDLKIGNNEATSTDRALRGHYQQQLNSLTAPGTGQ